MHYATLWGTSTCEGKEKKEEEKKPSTWRESNPKPLDHEDYPLSLCCNHCQARFKLISCCSCTLMTASGLIVIERRCNRPRSSRSVTLDTTVAKLGSTFENTCDLLRTPKSHRKEGSDGEGVVLNWQPREHFDEVDHNALDGEKQSWGHWWVHFP